MSSGRYYHFTPPSLYQVKKSFARFTLYLNINSHNIIEGLFFTGPTDSPWLPTFSKLCRLCEGQRFSNGFISHIHLPSPVKYWNLPLWLLRATYREFFQTHYPHNMLAGQKAEDLICRCFGVYFPQFLQFTSLKEVTDETRAGGGCSRCRRQIENIIGTQNIPDLLVSEKTFDTIRKLTELFVKKNFPTTALELEGIYGNHIKVIFSGDEREKNRIFQSIEKLIEYNFHLKISLSHDGSSPPVQTICDD